MNEDDDQIGFIRKNRLALGVIAVLLVSLVTLAIKMAGGRSVPRREPEITMIHLPPPPPPPTPPQQPTPEEKVVDQPEQKLDVPEEKPKDEPKPPEPPIGTGVKGDGKGDSFGLTGSRGNGFGGGSGGSVFAWYTGRVQARVADALRNNSQTREASLSLKVRLWADSTGRISRAELVGSTGDPALDSAVKEQVLSGLQLQDAPPDGMPMPIILRLTARRPQ